jgi:DNA-binding transcriptional ArsR family regulator
MPLDEPFFEVKIQPMAKKKNESVLITKQGSENILLDYAELRKAVLVLRAINHKLRQQIIELLDENEELTVTDIYVNLRLEQSVASQHLAILRRAGVVQTTREGKFIHYSLNRDRLDQIGKLVEDLAGEE